MKHVTSFCVTVMAEWIFFKNTPLSNFHCKQGLTGRECSWKLSEQKYNLLGKLQ